MSLTLVWWTEKELNMFLNGGMIIKIWRVLFKTPLSWSSSVIFTTHVGGCQKKFVGRMLVTEIMVEAAKQVHVFSFKEIQKNNKSYVFLCAPYVILQIWFSSVLQIRHR